MKQWTVGDVMTQDVIFADDSATYREIVQKLAEHRVSALPVVDSRRRVIGVVSEADLLHKVALIGEDSQPGIVAGRTARKARAKSSADLAKDLMTTPAIVIGPDRSLTVAAKLLDTHHVKRLPVVDADSRLVGIVSRADLLRPYLRGDRQILADIRDGVLRQSMWLEPDAVEVTVTDGVVTLNGRLDRRTTVQLLGHLVGSVAGVTEVHNGLTWELDDSKMANSGYFRSHPFSTEYEGR